jgi:diacylglycerol O-acyltransferase
LAASSRRFVFNKPCSGERRFCWTEIPFADVQAIRESAGGTVNDVALAVVARAVSKYVREHGESVHERFLRVMCPVNVRQDRGESLGNRISFLPVALPLDIDRPTATLRAIAERTEIMKNARAAHLVALLAAWLGAAPPPVQALFWRTIPDAPLPLPLFHMICTNVPGSPTPLYAMGRRMIASYPHVPTGYELGVNCAFQSYDGKLFCGLTADASVVPDAARLRSLIDRSFQELRRAALGRGSGARRPRQASQTPQPAAVHATAPAVEETAPVPGAQSTPQ